VFEGKIEEELWKSYKKTKDPKIREHFVNQYAPLVKYVAGKIAIGMPQNVDFDDLVGYGVFGLLDAIDKFDPDRHIKFKTCLLYTSPSPRDRTRSRMPSSA